MSLAKPLIVDADAHVNPAHDMWADYLPASLKEHAPVIEHGEDADYVIFEGRKRKVNLISAMAGRKGKDFKMEGRISDTRQGGWMPAARLEDMDQDGMDVAILFGGGPLGTANNELYKASFGAYNRWLADFCHHSPKRLVGVGYVPMQDVDEAIEMMRDFAKLGFKAINIPAFPMAIERYHRMAVMRSKRGADWRSRTASAPMPIPNSIRSGRRHRTRHADHDPPRRAYPALHTAEIFLSDLLMSKFAMARADCDHDLWRRVPALP